MTPDAPPVTWRALVADAERQFQAAGLSSPAVDARRIGERAAGVDGEGDSPWALVLDQPPPGRAAGFFAQMVERRATGEPLQYVLGRWSFRQLELLVDRRVLIPRPETEVVVAWALAEAARLAPAPQPLLAVDLGTGSGAIAFSLAVERPGAEVWATDQSPDALAVARANLAGLGTPARSVRLVEGSWFDALPADLRGRFDLVVTNPPYVAEDETLPDEVAEWEPREALVAGPTGLEAMSFIVDQAPGWLAARGALVVELAPHQAETAADHVRTAGFADVEVHPDLAGRPRVLVARREAST